MSCVICSEYLLPTEEVYSTPCGHIFHFNCVAQWLKRSKTCPQCREKVTDSKIHRLYFNFSNNESFSDDCTELLRRNESLVLKISKAEADFEQIQSLRRKVRTLENDLAVKSTENDTLNKEVTLLRKVTKVMDDQKKEINHLRQYIETSRKNLENELTISENKRLELEKKLRAYEKKEKADEGNVSSDIEEASAIVDHVENEKQELKEVLSETVFLESGESPAKKAKPALKEQYLLCSPIVISEDSSDEDETIDLTMERIGNEENRPFLRYRTRRRVHH